MWKHGNRTRNNTAQDGEGWIDSLYHRFDSKIHDDKLIAVIRMVTEHNGEKIYGPINMDSKIGLPVL